MTTICTNCVYHRINPCEYLDEVVCRHYSVFQKDFRTGNKYVNLKKSLRMLASNKGNCSGFLDSLFVEQRAKNIKQIRKSKDHD